MRAKTSGGKGKMRGRHGEGGVSGTGGGDATTECESEADPKPLQEDCALSPLRCESNGMRRRVSGGEGTRTDKQGRRAKAWQRAEASCAKPTVQLRHQSLYLDKTMAKNERKNTKAKIEKNRERKNKGRVEGKE